MEKVLEMKSEKQIDEFAASIPIGTIMEVPESFDKKGFLDMNGDKVHKDDFPKLADIWRNTAFDRGDYLILIEAKYLSRVLAADGISFSLGVNTGNKLIVRAE